PRTGWETVHRDPLRGGRLVGSGGGGGPESGRLHRRARVRRGDERSAAVHAPGRYPLRLLSAMSARRRGIPLPPLRLLGLLLLTAILAACAPAEPESVRTLRVCADPNNLPFSNEQEEGFENRLAHLVAEEMDARLSYTWWAQRRGFIRNT